MLQQQRLYMSTRSQSDPLLHTPLLIVRELCADMRDLAGLSSRSSCFLALLALSAYLDHLSFPARLASSAQVMIMGLL